MSNRIAELNLSRYQVAGNNIIHASRPIFVRGHGVEKQNSRPAAAHGNIDTICILAV